MPMVKRCAFCKERFETPPSVKHRCCSYECRVALSAARAIKTCEGCGQSFKKHPKRGDKQRFCTHACSIAHAAQLRRMVAVPPTTIPNTRWIPLTQGKFALVDERDFEMLSKFMWHLDGKSYVATKINRQQIKMHSMIIGRSSHKHPIDHRNRNPLDNRRKNLRVVTGGQNRVNSKINDNNTSGFKGVHRCAGGWVARIGYNDQRLYLGYFQDPELAARAYDDAARKLFGDAAKLNFGVGS